MDGLPMNLLGLRVLNWIDELEIDPKNENACSVDNPDCEGCGS